MDPGIVARLKFGFLLVRLSEQALQTDKHALHVVDGTPLVLQNVQADAAREVEVGVVDGRLEEHGRRRIGIVAGERERELQFQAVVGSVGRPGDGRRPREKVAICVREGGDPRGGREHQLHEFGLKAEHRAVLVDRGTI